MTVSRDVRLNVIAETRKYQQEMSKIPGVTEREAARAAVKWEKELTKAAVASAREQEKAAKKSANSWSTFGSVLAANLSAGAVKAAAEAVLGYADSIAASVDEVNTLAQQTGLANETIAGLRLAADATGKSVEELIPPDLAKRILETSQGIGRAHRGFEGLGISVTDTAGDLKSTDVVLRETIDALQAIEDPGRRAALATQALGTQGALMLSSLGSSDALDAFVSQAERFGVDVGPEAVASTSAWQQAQAELGTVLDHSARSLFDMGGGLQTATAFLNSFNLGLIATVEFGRTLTEEVLAAMGKQLEGIALILSGQFAEGLEVFREGYGPEALTDALVDADAAAREAARAFFDQSNAVAQAAASASDAVAAEQHLTAALANTGKQASSTNKEESRLAREREQRAAAFISAVDEVEAIINKAADDQVNAFQRVAMEEEQQLRRIEELEALHGSTALSAMARAEVEARAARDTAELYQELHEQSLELQTEFDELDAYYKDQQHQRIQRNTNAALAGFANLASAADALLGLELRNAEELAGATAARLDQEWQLRKDLNAAIEEADTAADKAELERQRDSAKRAIQFSKKQLREQEQQAVKLFRMQQGIEVASILMTGAQAAIAALAPPPVGAGPVFGPLLAKTVAAATAAQVAVVMAQKPPQFDAGFAGFTQASDNFGAVLRQGEGVTNQRLTEAIGREALQEANQTGQLPGRGVGSVVVMLPNGRELGRVMVDEMDAGRELTRAMNTRTNRRPGVRPVYLSR